jgi:hypothetical protein
MNSTTKPASKNFLQEGPLGSLLIATILSFGITGINISVKRDAISVFSVGKVTDDPTKTTDKPKLEKELQVDFQSQKPPILPDHYQ